MILITGGAGFIGSHLTERLCCYQEVVVLDSSCHCPSRAPLLRAHPKIRAVQADVLDPASLDTTFAGVDTVIHLAALAGVSTYYREPLRTLQVNVLGTVNVLNACVERGVKRLVYFSSSEVFGPFALGVGERDMYCVWPVSDRRGVYATSKIVGEQFVLRYAERHGFACTIVRPFNIYGPRQTGEGAISNFCRAVASRQPMTVYGEGSALRSWCYVSDLVDATEAILRTPEAAGVALNIGNPREVETTLGLARRIARLVPGAAFTFKDTDRAEVRVRIPAIEKAREILSFTPKVDLDEGLRLTLAWYLSGAPVE